MRWCNESFLPLKICIHSTLWPYSLKHMVCKYSVSLPKNIQLLKRRRQLFIIGMMKVTIFPSRRWMLYQVRKGNWVNFIKVNSITQLYSASALEKLSFCKMKNLQSFFYEPLSSLWNGVKHEKIFILSVFPTPDLVYIL